MRLLFPACCMSGRPNKNWEQHKTSPNQSRTESKSSLWATVWTTWVSMLQAERSESNRTNYVGFWFQWYRQSALGAIAQTTYSKWVSIRQAKRSVSNGANKLDSTKRSEHSLSNIVNSYQRSIFVEQKGTIILPWFILSLLYYYVIWIW